MLPIDRSTGILAATGERIAHKQIRAAYRMARPFFFASLRINRPAASLAPIRQIREHAPLPGSGR